MTDLDLFVLLCILLSIASSVLAVYAWQEHEEAQYQRIRAEEQATWADHFQAALDDCTAENARLRRLLTQRQPEPQPVIHQQSICRLPIHTVTPAQFNPN